MFLKIKDIELSYILDSLLYLLYEHAF